MTTNNAPWWDTGTPDLHVAPTPRRWPSRARAVATVAVIAAITVAVTAWVLPERETGPVDVPGHAGVVAKKQDLVALAAGCGPIYSHKVTSDSGTIPATTKDGHANTVRYKTRIPMMGPFWEAPAQQKVWTLEDKKLPALEQLLHNQYNGDVVIYYTDALAGEQKEELLRLRNSQPESRFVVVPWDTDTNGPLPGERSVAYAAWNASQTCHQFSVYSLDVFAAQHPEASAPGHHKPAPPASIDTD